MSELSDERARCVKCSKRSVYPWESGGAALVGSKAEAGAQARVWGGGKSPGPGPGIILKGKASEKHQNASEQCKISKRQWHNIINSR